MDRDLLVILGSGRGGPAPIFDPLESSTNWTLIGATPSSMYGQGSDISIHDNASGAIGLSYKNQNITDARVSARVQFINPGAGNNPYFIVARMIDVNNFVGVRIVSGFYEVWSFIAGAGTRLDASDLVATGTEGAKITLSVTGPQVIFGINNSYQILAVGATILTAGFVGIIQASWTLGDTLLTKSFGFIENTGIQIPSGIALLQTN